MGEPIVSFRNVTRRFGDLVAVRGASIDIMPGEVLALLGENGAGKSTLMKLLYGIYPPSEGEIWLDGQPSPIRTPSDAMANRVGMVFQHFSQLPALSVRENLLAAWPRTPFLIGRGNRRTDAVLENLRRLAPGLNPNRLVADLSVAEQQLVELCKVINIEARVVILDEPTSVLAPAEARLLYGFIRQLAADGLAVILITHKLADVEACADRITVMRRGEIVDVSGKGARSMAETVALMMGAATERRLQPPERPARRVERLLLRDVVAEAPGSRLRGITLAIAAGEIVGIAGVAGNGQPLLAEVVAGVAPISGGDVVLDGESIARHGEDTPLSTPLGYIPEQPRLNAVVETLSLKDNLELRRLAGGSGDEADSAGLLRRFDVRPPEPPRAAATLSGGNLQKLVLARELGVIRPAVLACYPTMGLDLGAVADVYRELFAQAKAGAAILWISEDLDDLLAAAHRIAVLREGELVAVLDNDGTLTRDAIGAMMTGSTAPRVAG